MPENRFSETTSVRCWWFIGRIIIYKRLVRASVIAFDRRIKLHHRGGKEKERERELSRIFACSLACSLQLHERNCRERFKPPLHRTSGQPSNKFHVWRNRGLLLIRTRAWFYASFNLSPLLETIFYFSIYYSQNHNNYPWLVRDENRVE